MEDHPRKRRKTSPLTSVTLNISNTATRAASEDGNRSTPAGLFMSPTKASLARFNPHLLPQHTSAEKKQQNPACRQSQSFGEKKRPGPNAGMKMMDDISTAPQQKIQAVKVTGDSLQSVEGGATVSLGLSTTSKGDRSYFSPRRSQILSVELLSARQFQADMEQDLRASPPEADENEEQTSFDTISDRKASGSQCSISEPMNPVIDTIEIEVEKADGPEPVLPFTPTKSVLEDTEPRLPSTPSQLGLEAPPSPPKGLFFHNTRRKPKRNKRSVVKSSPSKPIAPSPAMNMVKSPRESGLGPRILVTNTQQTKPTQPERRGKKTNGPAASNLKSSVDFSPTLSTLSQRLALFLPFSRPLISNADSPPPDSIDRNDTGALHIDSTETTIRSTSSNDPNLRHQSVVLTSPQQLSVVKFQLSTNIETGKNTDLIVSSIAPWANVELGQWLRIEAVQLDKPIIERTISRYWELSEIRACCWYRCEEDLPKHKALASEPTQNPSLEAQQDTTKLPTKSHSGRPKINGILLPHSFPEDPVPNPLETTTNNDPSPKAHPIPSQSFHQHLGQQTILFTGPPKTTLLITWLLTISPTGAVHSSLSAHAAFPEAWTQAPGGEALGKVGEAFDLLVEEVGVLQAVKVLWGLIFGT